MKTLDQIKDEVAKGHGYSNLHATGISSDIVDDIAKLYAQSAIDEIKEKIAEEVKMKLAGSDYIIESIRSVTIELK